MIGKKRGKGERKVGGEWKMKTEDCKGRQVDRE